MNALKQLEKACEQLSAAVDALRFGSGVTHVYNPLDYARRGHFAYLQLALAAGAKKKVVFLGMNPGPFGMAQTGVPFGEVAAVRGWMGICENVGHPAQEHPRRPVEGFDCPRAEVSGQRLWGLFAQKFGTAENFFRDHFVANYCPLLFLDAGEKHCRNLTPDKFAAADTEALYAACDAHLRAVVEIMQPDWVIGVGKFAEDRAYLALTGMSAKDAARRQAAGGAATGAAATGGAAVKGRRGRPSKTAAANGNGAAGDVADGNSAGVGHGSADGVALPAAAVAARSASDAASADSFAGVSAAPRIGTILHPSPASPVANRGWAAQAQAQLEALGIW